MKCALSEVVLMTDMLESVATNSVCEDLARAHDTIANLRIALKTSRQIGMAVGILMARFTLTDDEAFTMLARASQNQNRKVRDMAEDIILAGTLD
jgi:AmiR/NasT family two-component response regulator